MHDHPSERRAASAPTKSRYAQNCSLFRKGSRSPASPAHLEKTTHTFFFGCRHRRRHLDLYPAPCRPVSLSGKGTRARAQSRKSPIPVTVPPIESRFGRETGRESPIPIRQIRVLESIHFPIRPGTGNGAPGPIGRKSGNRPGCPSVRTQDLSAEGTTLLNQSPALIIEKLKASKPLDQGEAGPASQGGA
jgi:hypothetical protein